MAVRLRLLTLFASLTLFAPSASATCTTGHTGTLSALQSEIASCINSNGSRSITGGLEGQVLQDILTYLSANGGTGPGPAPTNSVLPVISGTPQVGQTLTASLGTWSPTPTGYSGEKWLSGGSPISGATSTTYVPVIGDVGATLTFTVIATDAGGSTSATSAGVGPVAASGGGAPTFDFSVSSNSQYLP